MKNVACRKPKDNRTTRRSFLYSQFYVLNCLSLAAILCATHAAYAGEWPFWRGPEQTGLAREKAVVTTWSPDGTNLIWKSPVGGRTTPIVMGGRVFFTAPVGDGECLQEAVVCLDAQNGKTLWQYTFNVYMTDIVANRVGWTAPVGDPETGNIYAHGTGGDLLCLSRDGKLLWSHSLFEEYNRVSGYGGRLMTPVIDEDRVVVSFLNTNWGNQAKPNHRYFAFDKLTGEQVWWAEPGGAPLDTTYAIPLVTVIGGRRLLIAPNADGKVYAMESRTGRVIWSFALCKVGLNVSPVSDGKFIYAGHSEENLDTTLMGRLVCIDGSKAGDITKSGEVWRIDGLDAGYASPALANGRIYVVDNSANLHCVDAKAGKAVWHHKLGRVGKGSPVVTSDGVIYVGEQNGTFFILKDAGDHCEELSKYTFRGPNDTVDELFGSPALCGGRVYFMTRYGSYCLGVKDALAETQPIPASARERPVDCQTPSVLLVAPADLTLAPGATVKLSARVLGDVGGWLGTPTDKVEWTLVGLKGSVLKNGELTAPTESAFSAGMVTAKLGALTANARVRICPALPINESFEKMKPDAPPPGWSGVMGKTKIVERDGSKCFKKVAEKAKPSPTFKMRAFAGPPLPIGYTVESDVLGAIARKRFKPDMGIINDRYELIVLGQAKELELARWRDEPTHALRKRIPFEMRFDEWSRFKLRVEKVGDAAKIRGKIWPRGEKEPAEWTIELDDPCPNGEGAPGLFAISNGTTDKSDGAEVYYDNFRVYGNE